MNCGMIVPLGYGDISRSGKPQTSLKELLNHLLVAVKSRPMEPFHVPKPRDGSWVHQPSPAAWRALQGRRPSPTLWNNGLKQPSRQNGSWLPLDSRAYLVKLFLPSYELVIPLWFLCSKIRSSNFESRKLGMLSSLSRSSRASPKQGP